MNEEIAGAKGLRDHKNESLRKTRRELELALSRLRHGNPRKVKKGTPATASSVAEEAGIDRSTLYRYHEPVLREIQKLNDATPRQQLMEKRGELADMLTKHKQCRDALEIAQAELTQWARENYALAHRIRALEDKVRKHEQTIKDLRSQLTQAGVVIPIKALTGSKKL